VVKCCGGEIVVVKWWLYATEQELKKCSLNICEDDAQFSCSELLLLLLLLW